jgi:hypothetical protein
MLDQFDEIVVLDFEFQQPDGHRPNPLCLCVHGLRSGETRFYWREELRRMKRAPFDTSRRTLVVAFFASAEMGCFLELGWERPKSLVCLHAENRAVYNGILPFIKGQYGLLNACARRGIATMPGQDKADRIKLITGQTSWTPEELELIEQYCREDVAVTVTLFSRMALGGEIDWPYALLRGRYTHAAAVMERHGVPINAPLLELIIDRWDVMKFALIRAIDEDYGVYEGTHFRQKLFAQYLERECIPWPLTPTGRLTLENNTFRDQAKLFPQLEPLRELRSSLEELKLGKLAVGPDGRNRTLLGPFGSQSGRNQPSNAKFIFGPAKWIRHLIRPPEGYGIAYVDWRSQEIAIAAALFGDERMRQAYLTGDVYLGFAKQAGLAPQDATKESHGHIRDLCKVLVLAINYGGGDQMLARRLGVDRGYAAELRRLHQETYPTYWQRSEQVSVSAFSNGLLMTPFGWPLHVQPAHSPNSVTNQPMQGAGSDMMRLAAIAGTEAGLGVVAPIHDAFLLVAPLERLEADIRHLQEIMTKAGEAVTDGMPVFTDAKLTRWPDSYTDERGAKMWSTVTALLAQSEALPRAA